MPWHTLGRLDRAAVTRVAVQGRPHLWAMPTIYRCRCRCRCRCRFSCRWGDVARGRASGRRGFGPPHGQGGRYLQGGVHMTEVRDITYRLVKGSPPKKK